MVDASDLPPRDVDLEELKRLNAERLTGHGDWLVRDDGSHEIVRIEDRDFDTESGPRAELYHALVATCEHEADAAFIAAIANATPALLEEISSGKEREARLTEALIEAAQVIGELAGDGWLADDTMEHMPGVKRARKLLARAVFADALEQSQ